MKQKHKVKKTTKKLFVKWSIGLKTIPVLIFTMILKILSHNYGFEIMDLNTLYTSLLGGTIFLLGFLISGVLSDYKESEKIPAELSTCLRSLYDDGYTIYKTKNSDTALRMMDYIKSFVDHLMPWFYKKERTLSMLKRLSTLNEYFIDFDKNSIESNYLVRMKSEQSRIRQLILRVDTIRDTDFVGSAYAIVEAMGLITAFGLIIIKIEPFYASVFLTLIVTFLILYMFFLIKDLDNPFNYSIKGENSTEISLKLIHDLKKELNEIS